MKVFLLSDIFLQLKLTPFALPLTGADVLLLAGNVGDPFSGAYADLLAEAAAGYPRVMLVAGNHEYHQCFRGRRGGSMAEVDARLAALARAHPNVDVLANAAVEHGGVRFLGTTLWAPEAADIHQLALDSYRIREFGAVRRAELHAEQRSWLAAELAKPRVPTVVVTHHAPVLLRADAGEAGAGASRRAGGPPAPFALSPGQENELLPPCGELLSLANAWCHGGMQAVRAEVSGCRLFANPVGYTGLGAFYDAAFLFDVAPASAEDSTEKAAQFPGAKGASAGSLSKL